MLGGAVGKSRASIKPSKPVLEMSRMLLNEISNIDTSRMKDASKAEMAKAELAERLNFFLQATEETLDETAGDEKDPKSVKSALKLKAKIILPHVGLVVLSILYTFLGAVIFMLIEAPNEIDLKHLSLQKIEEFRSKFSNEIWSLRCTSNTNDSVFVYEKEDRYETFVKQHLDNFTQILHEAFRQNYVTLADIEHNTTTTKRWSFIASLFFSATAITAIDTYYVVGYGHLVPHTFAGRLSCLIFCLIGIPLILVTIADLGRFLSVYVINIYMLYSKCFNWALRSCRKCCQKLRLCKKEQSQSTIELGLAQMLMANNVKQRSFVNDDELPTGTVSITFVLIILVGYTAFGAGLFCLWEDWSFFQGFFYSFTTVTTIGFGDIVPDNDTFIPLTMLYIFVGLIITTMCVDLVGSQYIREIHDFGRNVKQISRVLSYFGGLNIGEIFNYVAFLQKGYGITPEQFEKMAMLPDDYLLDCMLKGRQPNLNYVSSNPFVPNDIYHIKWIEKPRTLSFVSEHVMASSTETLDLTSRCSTSRTPRDWYYHMIFEHKK